MSIRYWQRNMVLSPDGDGAGSAGETSKPATGDGTDVRPAANQESTDVRQVDYKEVVGLRKETRETATKLAALETMLAKVSADIQKIAPREDAKPTAAETKADTAAAALAATRSLALELAYEKAGIKNAKMKEILSLGAPTEIDKIPAYVAECAKEFSPEQKPAPAPPAHNGKSDTGSPGGTASDIIPDNPLHWTRDQAWAIFNRDPKELIRRTEAHAYKGTNTNPYSKRRR